MELTKKQQYRIDAMKKEGFELKIHDQSVVTYKGRKTKKIFVSASKKNGHFLLDESYCMTIGARGNTLIISSSNHGTACNPKYESTVCSLFKFKVFGYGDAVKVKLMSRTHGMVQARKTYRKEKENQI